MKLNQFFSNTQVSYLESILGRMKDEISSIKKESNLSTQQASDKINVLELEIEAVRQEQGSQINKLKIGLTIAIAINIGQIVYEIIK